MGRFSSKYGVYLELAESLFRVDSLRHTIYPYNLDACGRSDSRPIPISNEVILDLFRSPLHQDYRMNGSRHAVAAMHVSPTPTEYRAWTGS